MMSLECISREASCKTNHRALHFVVSFLAVTCFCGEPSETSSSCGIMVSDRDSEDEEPRGS